MESTEAWAACGWRMRQLQAVALAVRASETGQTTRGRVLLVRLLQVMERLRAYVNGCILLGDSKPAMGGGSVVDEAGELVGTVSEEVGCRCPSRNAVDEERIESLQRELLAAEQAAPNDGERDVLVSVIQSLRVRERSLDFHRELLSAMKLRDDGYSVDNFAYGNTPFDTWCRVCLCGTIQDAVSTWPARSTTHECPDVQGVGTNHDSETTLQVDSPCVVVGSSSGSLVFFTAMLLNRLCTGVEILPFLHGVAVDLKRQHKVPSCGFILGDILDTRLYQPRLVVLASQCWDAKLYYQVIVKLEHELAADALVVDYRDGLARSDCFQLAERIQGLRVSWNPAQTMFIYKRI